MKRQKLAVLVGQAQESSQAKFIEGFLQKAFEKDFDVYVVSTYQRDPETDAEGIGEGYIFSLINYDDFAGVVVLPDTIRNKGLMLQIENDLQAYKGSVLVVDKETNKFPFITQPNAQPIYRVTEHLIVEHGYKEIGFLSGIKGHPHSIAREEGFRKCMQDHGLSVNESWVLYGDYWYGGGERAANTLIEQKQSMPRAIVCANDYMAISLADVLEKNGYRIPEDVAIASYDSVKLGQTAPQPITSIPLASTSYGEYAAQCMEDLLNGKEMSPFKNEDPMFVGSSCGCDAGKMITKKLVRDTWRSYNNDVNYYIRMSRLTEEFVLQTSFRSLMDSVQTYTYQIREFDSFRIYLNEAWKYAETNVAAIRENSNAFTKNVLPILVCGRSGEGADRLDFENLVPLDKITADFDEETDLPRCTFVTPINFEDNLFGYATISYGNEVRCINDNYVMWLRSLMIAMECYYRNEVIRQSNGAIEKQQILDPLTGMFNYEGLTKHARPMVERGKLEKMFISILAVDISGLDKINSSYGRKEGDVAIKTVSQMIFDAADEGAMCCRLGNDEFIIAELSAEATHDVINRACGRIYQKLDVYNSNPKKKYEIKIHTGNATASIATLAAMEDLINEAVSNKNGNKISEQKMQMSLKLTPEEEEKAELVKHILDENLFKYNFQPIVNASDGSIFAYEALMRSKTEVFVSPLEIIRFATHFDRLQDVERATFFNVLEKVSENMDVFNDKKVFINSIPGYQLEGEEAELLKKKLTALHEHVVVELTEQTEADDETINMMRKRYSSIGIETAVDDYGTGYSNIVNLLRYLPNYVKIDRMLLSGIQDNLQKQHFVKDIVLFAKENDFKILAEGVETIEELKTVIEIGVDLIQGYYTARPSEVLVPAIETKISDEIIKINAELRK